MQDKTRSRYGAKQLSLFFKRDFCFIFLDDIVIEIDDILSVRESTRGNNDGQRLDTKCVPTESHSAIRYVWKVDKIFQEEVMKHNMATGIYYSLS